MLEDKRKKKRKGVAKKKEGENINVDRWIPTSTSTSHALFYCFVPSSKYILLLHIIDPFKTIYILPLTTLEVNNVYGIMNNERILLYIYLIEKESIKSSCTSKRKHTTR